MNMKIEKIGTVKSKFKESADPFEMRKHESTIVIEEQYTDGLFRIEDSRYIQVLFLFDRSSDYTLKGPRYHGDVKGVFASRSPRRPSNIGVTTVELLERSENELRVLGLDALEGTPVIDIKPYAPPLDHLREQQEQDTFLTRNPRSGLVPLIKNREMRKLLYTSGQLHGHFCPGVALGVAAATEGAHRLAELRGSSVASVLAADGMEELLAVVETNSCFSDGIQAVSGCTFGNNSLIYRDLGKTAVTFTDRSGKGVRVVANSEYGDVIDGITPRFSELFDAVVKQHIRDEKILEEFKTVSREVSFAIVELPPETILSVSEITIEIPRYAPIRESVRCGVCGESVMGGKTVPILGVDTCLICANRGYYTLTGEGIGINES
jgi:formylmethanofuran dehydrogenase subunit E